MAETDGVFDFVYDSHCVCFDVVMVCRMQLRLFSLAWIRGQRTSESGLNMSE